MFRANRSGSCSIKMSARAIVHIVGARPQFVKAAVVLSASPTHWDSRLVHTGQHYDSALSEVFFKELDIPEPDVNLGAGSGSHAQQTAAMLTSLDEYLARLKPGVMVVYGDTNSTLAGALVAAKRGWLVVHVEAGLRSFDRGMPEEINRVAVDHLSDRLLCPTQRAMAQLQTEGLQDRSVFTGDVMLDVALNQSERAKTLSQVGKFLDGTTAEAPAALAEVGFNQWYEDFAVATVHRAANTDDPSRLSTIIAALGRLPYPVLMPLHPRTKAAMDRFNVTPSGNLHCIPPVGYLDFAALMSHARHVLTDSGGVQKEALFHGCPCTTLRDTTEWPETLRGGWNMLVDADPSMIIRSAERPRPTEPAPTAEFGNGRAGDAVCGEIAETVTANLDWNLNV